MTSINSRKLNLDAGLKLTFVLLVSLIVGGNGLLLWQFHLGQLQAERVARVTAQMTSVLRLQGSLLALHQRMGELAKSKDASGLRTESAGLESALLGRVQQTRGALTPSSPGKGPEPQVLPSLDAIEIGMVAQVEAINRLASSGDWNAVNFRIDQRLNPFEVEASELVKTVDQTFDEEFLRSQSNMKRVQDRILILVPATAIYTFVIATLFAWVIARKILEVRVEERVSERTRIARDLHDTLLQSFHGLLLSFQTVYDLLPGRPVEAKATLGSTIDEAAQAITEGRDAVQGLRSSTIEDDDIAEAIKGIGNELATDETNVAFAIFHSEVEGTPRSLHPFLRDEVYRIASEALRNAFRHARARQIDAEILYGDKRFLLRVRDDGRGIDRDVLLEEGRIGHFGLQGMRERANLVGGKLAVLSELDAGTSIELSIPASVAYAENPLPSWFSEKIWRRETETKMKS